MRNNEIVIMIIGSILLLGFVIYMLIFSFHMSKTNLIREDIKNDSIIFKENLQLKMNDSVMIENKKKLNNLIDNNENRLQRLENRKTINNRNTVFLLKENEEEKSRI